MFNKHMKEMIETYSYLDDECKYYISLSIFVYYRSYFFLELF